MKYKRNVSGIVFRENCTYIYDTINDYVFGCFLESDLPFTCRLPLTLFSLQVLRKYCTPVNNFMISVTTKRVLYSVKLLTFN